MRTAIRILLPLLCAVPSLLFGQGILRGSVVDSITKEILIGANVYFDRTAIGGTTDKEGQFRIPAIPPGSYRLKVSYIGYRARDLAVEIVQGENGPLRIALLADAVEGEEVVVTAQMRGQTEAINRQLSSNTIVSVVSEERIKELPDANAAEAIGRLPGVSLLRSGGEANKVILRGMSDKFTTVTMDGVKIPPTDADARGVDLSTISQGSLSGVELYKALTPDRDADAIGGTINLVTRMAPEERLLRLDAKGSYNKLMDDYSQYDLALRYGERFFDNLLGVQLLGNAERRNRSSEGFNLDYNQNVQGGRDYEISDLLLEFTDEIRKRYGGSIFLDLATGDGGTVKLNTTYNMTDRSYLFSTRNYPYGTGLRVSYTAREREQEISTFNSSLQGQQYLWGLTETWGLSFAQSKAEDPYDYAIDFIEPSIVENGMTVAGMLPGAPALRSDAQRLIPFAVNNFQAAYLNNAYYRSEENLDKERTAFLDLAKSYTLGEKFGGELKLGGKYKVKDRSKVSSQLYSPYYLGYWRAFAAPPGSVPVRKEFTGTWFEPFYRRFLIDNSARNPFALDFLDPDPASRNLYDTYMLEPIVNRDALRKWYELNRYGVDSLGRSLEYYDDPSVQADFYDVTERVAAGYLMNTLSLGQTTTFIAGLRVESEVNDYGSRYSPSGLGGFPIPSGGISDTTASYTATFWLPNFQLLVRPTEFMNVRLAAYRALARPDYNLRLEKFVSQGGGGSVSLLLGNSQLKTATAWNYEVNTSFFGNTFGLITASAYYKEITDLFHMLNDAYTTGNSIIDVLGISWRSPHTGAYALTAPYNSPKPTKVWGFELEHQMDFRFLPGFLKNLVLSWNASLVRSETYIVATDTFSVWVKRPTGFPPPFDSISVQIVDNKIVERKQKLEGQPEFYANVALGYDVAGFSVRLSMFHQSEYNQSFSSSGLADQVINTYTRWDLALKYEFSRHVAVMLTLSNLTNIDERNSIYNRRTGWKLVNTSENYGMTADLGVRLTL